jgi:hypothetical protein
MFSFVKPGISNADTGQSQKPTGRMQADNADDGLDLDNLLKTLDSKPGSASGGSRSTHGGSRGYGYSSGSRPLPRSLAPTVTRSNQDFLKTEQHTEYDQDYNQSYSYMAQEDYTPGGQEADAKAPVSDAMEMDYEQPVRVQDEQENTSTSIKTEASVVPKSLTSTARKLQAVIPSCMPRCPWLLRGLRLLRPNIYQYIGLRV